jgi:hypothetical protein
MIGRLAAFAALALLIGARPLPDNTTVAPSLRTDLDSFSDARLLRDLQDELDDILEGHDPNEDVSPDELYDEVMLSVGDEGDEQDPEESEISLADLEAEMEEADTCVEDVVREIVGMPKEGCDENTKQHVEVDQRRGGPAATEALGSWMPPRRDIPSRGARTFQRYVRSRS